MTFKLIEPSKPFSFHLDNRYIRIRVAVDKAARQQCCGFTPATALTGAIRFSAGQGDAIYPCKGTQLVAPRPSFPRG